MSEAQTQFEAGIHESRLSEPQDVEVARYRAVSGLAVAGLIVGLLGPVAWADPLLWTVPLAGIVLSALALRRIAREAPALVGRKAALVGLIVSVLFLAAAVSEWCTYRWRLRVEAGQFAAKWFEFLRQGEAIASHQLTQSPEVRLPLDQGLQSHYPRGSDLRQELDGYLRRPMIRSLLALGKKARACCYDTESQYREDDKDVVEQVHAVTWEEAGKKKSFFTRLTLRRYQLPDAGRAFWQLANFDGPIRPKAMGGDKEK